ncbi:hypothetical protein Tfu_3006 [Thermobifida fusca YX]|uniref:Uncharacterized protein n=1 Tax=Thermobifida fusca (strain YX) TaxID=269800 RepID=Q47KI3_THEFY|nr:hypothetical protein Tfu_3006 [Thermobifida fusca YX]
MWRLWILGLAALRPHLGDQHCQRIDERHIGDVADRPRPQLCQAGGVGVGVPGPQVAARRVRPVRGHGQRFGEEVGRPHRRILVLLRGGELGPGRGAGLREQRVDQEVSGDLAVRGALGGSDCGHQRSGRTGCDEQQGPLRGGGCDLQCSAGDVAGGVRGPVVVGDRDGHGLDSAVGQVVGQAPPVCDRAQRAVQEHHAELC